MIRNIRDVWPLPDSALKPALALALAIEHAPMGILMLRNEDGSLEPVLTEGLAADACSRFGSQKPGEGPIGMACKHTRRVTIRDVLAAEDGLLTGPFRDIAAGMGFRALDVVPLILSDGNAIGAVTALFPAARRPSARSGLLAEACGRLMAIALDNARLKADADRRREIVEGLSSARMQFVARMGHELRTPLQSIAGYIDLIAMGQPDPLTERQRRMIERVRVSEQVLIQVIDDLIAMARLEAGRLDYRLRPVPVRPAITSAMIVVQPLAEKKRIRLEVQSRIGELCVRADEMKLKQVLINLMANAVKFTPPGGQVRVTCRAEGSQVVAFDVADTGTGIPEGKLEAAFEPYVQLGDSESRLAGSGLGLAISREFAYGMHGSLTATSAPGRGSTFSLRLPRILTPAA